MHNTVPRVQVIERRVVKKALGGRCILKAQTVDVRESAGRILCCTIFRQGGRKLLAKGHVLSADDIRLLETEGLGQVWFTEL